jgi:hypothetical protein
VGAPRVSRLPGGSHYVREYMNKDDAKRRHAGTYDSDVDFDVGPVDNFGLIPGWV